MRVRVKGVGIEGDHPRDPVPLCGHRRHGAAESAKRDRFGLPDVSAGWSGACDLRGRTVEILEAFDNAFTALRVYRSGT